jgi:indolepyruvate ferredoxin oxidoreductase beta subunit
VGVERSLEVFAAGFSLGAEPLASTDAKPEKATTLPPVPALRELDARVVSTLPPAVHPMALAALRRLTDYQDRRYASLYLDRIDRIHAQTLRRDDPEALLLVETARHLALWMTYEDTARVAELKIRSGRFERVTSEIRVKGDQILDINEYFHPRLEEIADTLPAGLGRRLMRPGMLSRIVAPLTQRGRTVKTTSLSGFLMLYGVAMARRWRRRSLRYMRESGEIEAWLQRLERYATSDYALAVEFARCQRLVKGYGDTHERGMRNLRTIEGELEQMSARHDKAARLAAMREAALADEHGDKLRALLQEWRRTSDAAAPAAASA